MNTKQTNKEWSWIKGSHGYGHEIMQLRDGENPPKRVCILDCQESAFLEYDTEFPIVPEANIEIGSDEHLNSANKRFDDETLQANARLIRSAPVMYDLLLKAVSTFEGESPKGSFQGDVYDCLYNITGNETFCTE